MGRKWGVRGAAAGMDPSALTRLHEEGPAGCLLPHCRHVLAHNSFDPQTSPCLAFLLLHCSLQIVTNKRQNETYFLYPCGLAPSADLIPAGAKAFAVPLTATSVSDTTIVAFMVSLLPQMSFFAHLACMLDARAMPLARACATLAHWFRPLRGRAPCIHSCTAHACLHHAEPAGCAGPCGQHH